MDNPKYTYTLFDESQKMFAEENIGGIVKVTYQMSTDGKHRNVESIELATEAQAVASNGYSDGSDKRCAALIMKDLRVADKVDDDNLLYKAMKKWVANQLNVPLNEPSSKPKEPPVYKNKQSKDPARASKEQIESIRRLLAGEMNIDLDEVDMTAATISYLKDENVTERDLSYEEAGEWIKSLQP